jgi:hypothetical protein
VSDELLFERRRARDGQHHCSGRRRRDDLRSRLRAA